MIFCGGIGINARIEIAEKVNNVFYFAASLASNSFSLTSLTVMHVCNKKPFVLVAII